MDKTHTFTGAGDGSTWTDPDNWRAITPALPPTQPADDSDSDPCIVVDNG